ncbi:MAG: TIGR03086 family protein [Ilumatobacter sp.]|nr:MAG: TIGR03086 family protein [Ilumatobacter sp.]
MEPTRQLDVIIPALEATVDRIQGMQMNDPTPCSEFTVHDVLNHMMVGGGTFSYMFRGEDPPHLTPPPVYGWVPKKEFCEVMDDLLDSVHSPGAMERPISSPVGEVSGETFARFVAVDGLIHGWDLATATGTTFEVPDDVVAEVDEFARTAITPELRENGMFAAPTAAPPDTSPLERLVAFSGRTL